MRLSGLILFVVGGAFAAAPANAQVNNPYSGGTRLTGPAPAQIPENSLSEQDKARETLARFAECEMKLRRVSIEQAIRLSPWLQQETEALRSVADNRCLGAGELTIPPDLLRGAFYAELYRRRFAAAPPSLPSSSIDFTDGTTAPVSDDAKTDIALRQFGDCVARADIGDAHSFVIARAGTAAETAALQRLGPHLSACVVRGSTWKLTKSVLTAVLSEVLYREGVAAVSTEGSGH